MAFLGHELSLAWPLIVHGNPTLVRVIGFTLEVVLVAVGCATVVGVPLGVVLGLGRFRGRRTLRALANAALGLPPALVGVVLYLAFARPGPLGGLQLEFTRRAVFIAQAILALPFTTALTAAAVEGQPAGLMIQARLLGARRRALTTLALREARVGVVAAIIAALGTSLSEVAAIALVGGNVYNYDQTLASATLFDVDAGNYAGAIAETIVLLALILVLTAAVGWLQQRGGGVPWLSIRRTASRGRSS